MHDENRTLGVEHGRHIEMLVGSLKSNAEVLARVVLMGVKSRSVMKNITSPC